MTTKLVKSTEEIEEWIRQWILVQSTPTPKPVLAAMGVQTNSTFPIATPQTLQQHPHHHHNNNNTTNATDDTGNHNSNADICNSLDAARSRRLIEYALHETAKVRTCL